MTVPIPLSRQTEGEGPVSARMNFENAAYVA